ncbi:unnamed protein product [Bursaphelenchus okinawaensis]|uniref:Uncharacterized protein n=1 Tax=Bursaphelenchus okinawaensis TaxID=465554 RepID=A0A811KD58_9BILA|nr:unnamed protein product [Bursaphelenchus okinawaensis]CAG9100845.1 unnamed protein product [Bursaphelenchus okinawaensis]
MIQAKTEQNEFRYPVKRNSRTSRFDEPAACHENIFYNREGFSFAFFIYDLYIISPVTGVKSQTLCAGTKTIHPDQYIDSLNDNEMNKTYVKEQISDCMTEKRSCVFDILTKKVLRDGYTNSTYAYDGLIVHTDCYYGRCIYMIKDTHTETSWYIPDTIDFFRKKIKIDEIHLLVPLISKDDKFFTSPVRYKYGASTVTTPTTSTTSTTTTTTTTTTNFDTDSTDITTDYSTDTTDSTTDWDDSTIVIDSTISHDNITTATNDSTPDTEHSTITNETGTTTTEEYYTFAESTTRIRKYKGTTNEMGVFFFNGTGQVGFSTLLSVICVAISYL